MRENFQGILSRLRNASNLHKTCYICNMTTMSQPRPFEAAKLKPVLHEKIERMDNQHLELLNRLLLQLEAEELADRLGAAFDKDHELGIAQRIPAIVQDFRAKYRYA